MDRNAKTEIAKPGQRNLLMRSLTYAQSNWERVLFATAGVAFLGKALLLLFSEQIASGSALFGMGFFSLFYSNLARFKRFKGLGFEAELWEDKQKEAADLIDRLKGIVGTYTREIIMGNVMRGRLSNSAAWEKHWALFDELTGKHTELGQDIDFSHLKRDVDRVFIFDMCSPLHNSVRKSIEAAKSAVNAQLREKYGQPVRDNEGWNADIAALRTVRPKIDDLYERAESGDVAQEISDLAAAARQQLLDLFGFEIQFDQTVLNRLETLSPIIRGRPIAVTPQLLEWAEWRDDVV